MCYWLIDIGLWNQTVDVSHSSVCVGEIFDQFNPTVRLPVVQPPRAAGVCWVHGAFVCVRHSDSRFSLLFHNRCNKVISDKERERLGGQLREILRLNVWWGISATDLKEPILSSPVSSPSSFPLCVLYSPLLSTDCFYSTSSTPLPCRILIERVLIITNVK